MATAPFPRWSESGLSSSEVSERRERGEGNNAPLSTSRTYGDIVRDNAFAFINDVLFILCAALFLLREYSDAIVAAGVVVANVLVSVFQEVRAKRTLDRIALLTRPKATVIRGGHSRLLDPSEIVIGDLLAVNPGDQVVVDGSLIGSDAIEVDESLLTGESDLVEKTPGDQLLSGSLCVNGSGRYEALKVGDESYAHKLTMRARDYRRVLTPLQLEVNVIIRSILLVALFFEVILVAQAPISHLSLVEGVKMSVVIAKLVPAGLFLSITLAYALGAVRIARQGALIQQLNAVESLSNVDVLCLDKTGTLTANRLKLDRLIPFGVGEVSFRHVLADFVASTSSRNHTIDALVESCPGASQRVFQEVPFSSERKWSALSFVEGDLQGSYVLGAPEVLGSSLSWNEELRARSTELSTLGMRVLLLAHARGTSLFGSQQEPRLPDGLTALGLISLRDELRPEAGSVLSKFAEAGVELKIISGDNQQTVVALAKQAGIGSDLKSVSGPELTAMDEAQRAEAAEGMTVFGRITPQQKEELIALLRRKGHYVAMIGDGVNDVLSLKKANLGIAMETGSQATRAVADIVLLKDSFGSLPSAVEEGQRIRNGLRDVLKLFLTRVLSVAILLMSVMILGGFPFDPKHISILTTLTVGIPSIGLATWSRAGQPPRGSVTRGILHFVLPSALTVALTGLAMYVFIAMTETREVLRHGETALTILSVVCGLLLLPFVEPPTPWWVGGDELSGDWRPTILAIALFAVLCAALATEPARSFFGLLSLSFSTYLAMAGLVAIWGLSLRYIWRASLLERFLGIDLGT